MSNHHAPLETDPRFRALQRHFLSSMNGETSKSMKELGAGYRLNYGVAYPRLKTIAALYEQDEKFARALWERPVREMKLMAIMLFPPVAFTSDDADNWVSSFEQLELVEHACMHLFSKLPFAVDKVMQWISSEHQYTQVTAFTLVARLGAVWTKEQRAILEQFAYNVLEGESLLLINAARLTLRTLIRNYPNDALDLIGRLKKGNQRNKAIAEELTYEIL